MLTYGFYNAIDHDRLYDAEQFGSIFDGVIEDGVYGNIGELFATIPGTGMQVVVKTGRAWFDHTWTLSDSYIPLSIENSDPLQTRIDAVILEVDNRIETRANSIKISKGVPSVNPTKPNLLHTGGVYQHALAYVTVKPAATSITAADIEINVGKEGCPLVTSPLKAMTMDDFWQQWNAEFTAWFDNLKATMTDNVVLNLQKQIDERVKIADKASSTDIKNGVSNKWVDSNGLKAYATPQNITPVGGIINSVENLADGTNVIGFDGTAVNRTLLPTALQKELSTRFSEPAYIHFYSFTTNVQPTSPIIIERTGTTAATGVEVAIGDCLCTISDYNYILLRQNATLVVLKAVANGTTITEAFKPSMSSTTGAATMFASGSNLIIGTGGNLVTVYNTSGTVQTQISCAHKSLAAFKINSYRTILIPVGNSPSPRGYVTDNNFSTSVAISTPTMSESMIGTAAVYIQPIIFTYSGGNPWHVVCSIGDPVCGIQKDSSGYLYAIATVSGEPVMIAGNITAYTPSYFKIIKSTDNGSNWTDTGKTFSDILGTNAVSTSKLTGVVAWKIIGKTLHVIANKTTSTVAYKYNVDTWTKISETTMFSTATGPRIISWDDQKITFIYGSNVYWYYYNSGFSTTRRHKLGNIKFATMSYSQWTSVSNIGNGILLLSGLRIPDSYEIERGNVIEFSITNSTGIDTYTNYAYGHSNHSGFIIIDTTKANHEDSDTCINLYTHGVALTTGCLPVERGVYVFVNGVDTSTAKGYVQIYYINGNKLMLPNRPGSYLKLK